MSITNEHRVVTPESVEFVYELGGLGSRMVATLIDHGLVLAALLALWMGACFFGGMAGLPMIALAILATFLIYFGYFALYEWRWNGQTPGKRVAELRVIDNRGFNIDLSQAIIRNLFRVVDMMPFLFALDFLSLGFYGIGGGAALCTRSHQRLGDVAAGTLVVRTRKRVMPSAVIAPNEKYNSLQEDGALRTRIRGLSPEERETLLQLCLRRNELVFETRQHLFREAAAYLERRLEIHREPYLSEEKFVQNIVAVAMTGAPSSRARW